MARPDEQELRELRVKLVALNMRPVTGPTQAASYLYREAKKAREEGRYLFARATGSAPEMPEWPDAALATVLKPFSDGELEAARRELEKAKREGVTVLTWTDDAFPINLKRSKNPPTVLYAKGELVPEDRAAVAIVGSRRASREYMEVAADLAYGVAKEGFTVVSGLARGIDRAAHEGALEAGGRTLAVLGSGVDVVYPPEHAPLARKIGERGALLSIFPMGALPLAYRFPARNWVIAGLCLAVVVVQAAGESGALITANAAACMGKEVMAVPGPLGHAAYEGSNGLIREGAKPVMSAADVASSLSKILQLENGAMGPAGSRSARRLGAGSRTAHRLDAAAAGQPPLIEEEPGPGESDRDLILGALVDGPCSVEDLAERCGLGVGEVQAVLTRLEIEGRVVHIGSGRWKLCARRWLFRPPCRG